MLIFFLLSYLIDRYYKKVEKPIFTNGISSDEITYITDYQDFLSSKLGDDNNYEIIYENLNSYLLDSKWTVFNIKEWLNSLKDQDYIVTLSLVQETSDGLFPIFPKVVLSKDFVVNKFSNPMIISSLIIKRLEFTYQMFNSFHNKDHFIIITYTSLVASY